MSEYLRISPGAKLTLFKHNKERWVAHRIKRGKDGKLLVVDKATKEIVKSFDTQEERDAFFYDETEIEMIWHHLRDVVHVDEGVTLTDIMNIIEKDENLGGLIAGLSPFFPKNALYSLKDLATLIITSKGVIHNNKFNLELNLGHEHKEGWNSDINDINIAIDNNITIYEDEKEVCQCIRDFSLMEFIQGLFCWCNIQQKCFLRKDGLFSDNDEKITDNIINRLFDVVDVDEDVTLGDVFELVESNDELKEFFQMYSWCSPINELHKQAKEPAENEKLWYLEIYRWLNLDGVKYGFKYFNFDSTLHAQGDLSDKQEQYYKESPDLEKPAYMNWSVGFLPMNALANLPFILGDFNVLGRKLRTDYTLLDFLDAIYWEISFYGGQLNEEEMEECEDCKKAIEKDGGIQEMKIEEDDEG